jgi:hypothetical protein
MDTTTLTNIVVNAILQRRNIEIDYENPIVNERRKRVVSPFDIGTTDPDLKDNFKDNLYAFSEDHVNATTGKNEPKVLVFAIRNIHSARLLDSTFDPVELYQLGNENDDVDWRSRPFNLVPERSWFAQQVGHRN